MKKSNPINVMHVVDKLSMDGVNPSSCVNLLMGWIANTDPGNFSFTVCSFRNPDPPGKILEENGIQVYYLGFGKYSLRNIRELCSLIEKNKIDIIHLHGYGAANFGRIASRKMGIFNVIHEHAILDVLPHQYLADFLLKNYTDVAIAVAESVRDFMIRGRSISRSKVVVVRNGIDLSEFMKCSDVENRKLRLELGIPEKVHVVGTVTRLRAEKGNAVFISAMPKIIASIPDVCFLIVGSGPLLEDLERMAVDLGVLKYIKFLGFRTDIVELLSIFDVNVIPSFREGFPLALIEAMSTGNAIVATKVAGMVELIKDGKTGFLIRTNDEAALSDKVVFLLKNPSEALRLSLAAKLESQRFSIKASADLLNQVYSDLLEKV